MHPPRHNAFTLVELLTVLGIVILMAGSVGLAMRDGSPGAALESGQATLASMLAAARGAAALSHTRAMLVVDADPDDERFLRDFQVAIETPPHSDHWQITGPRAVLPQGIYVVPSDDDLEGVSFSPAHGGAVAWPPERRSTLTLMPEGSVALASENHADRYLGLLAPLAPSGATDGGGKVVLAAARRTPSAVVFERPEWVRGVAISRYGAAILINDGSGFDF